MQVMLSICFVLALVASTIYEGLFVAGLLIFIAVIYALLRGERL